MDTFTQLLDLYARYPRNDSDSALQITELRQLTPATLDGSSLDLVHYKGVLKLSQFLCAISPAPLIARFGQAPALWAWMQLPTENYLRDICSVLGQDKSLLMRARANQWELFKPRTLDTLLEQYAFCENVERFDLTLAQEQLPHFLNGTSPQTQEYSFHLLRVHDSDAIGFAQDYGTIPYSIYLDAPYALALFHKGEPMVYASITQSEISTLKIMQLQGVVQKDIKQKRIKNAHHPGRVRWEDMFVHIFSLWAKDQGYGRLELQSAHNNFWFRHNPERLTAGIARYDGTAQRNGFVQNDKQDWYVHI